MSIRDTIQKQISRVLGYRLAPSGVGLYEYSLPPEWSYNSYLQAYGQLGTLMAVVNVKANAIAKAQWHLYNLNDDGEKEEITQHDLITFFNKPNPFQTRYQFMRFGAIYKCLVGEQFNQINFTAGNKPGEMWLAPPQYMAVIPGTDRYVDHYEYRRNMQVIEFDPIEIVHIYSPNPANPYRGISPAQALTSNLDSIRNGTNHQNKLFRNGGKPDFMLEYPAMATNQQREMMQSWDERYQGVSNAHRTGFLFGGKVSTIQLSNESMEFEKLLRYGIDMVCSTYGVPKTLIGLVADSNRANSESAIYVFTEQVVSPELAEIREAYNEGICPLFVSASKPKTLAEAAELSKTFNFDLARFKYAIQKYMSQRGLTTLDSVVPELLWKAISSTNKLYLDYDNPVPEDKQLKQNQIIQLWQTTLITRDDTLSALGLDTIGGELGSAYFKGNSLQAPAVGEPTAVLPPQPKAIEGVKKKTLTPEDKEAHWKAYVTNAEKYEKPFIEALNPIWKSQGAEAVKRFEKRPYQGTQLVDKTKFDNDYSIKMTPILQSAMLDATKMGYALIQPDNPHKAMPEVLSQAALAWLKTRITWAAEQINEETANQLSTALAEGFKNGESIPDIAARIRGVYDGFSVSRSQTIARTETIAASNKGNIQGYKDSGVVDQVEWLTAEDEKTCDICQGMDRDIENIDDAPGIPDSTHPNCRCVWLPVVNQ